MVPIPVARSRLHVSFAVYMSTAPRALLRPTRLKGQVEVIEDFLSVPLLLEICHV